METLQLGKTMLGLVEYPFYFLNLARRSAILDDIGGGSVGSEVGAGAKDTVVCCMEAEVETDDC